MNRENHIIRHFFNNVMIKLGYHSWILNIRPGHDSYCWLQRKRIDLGMNYNGDIRQILLHEIAHIGTARFCNQKHNNQFWKHVNSLTLKWLNCGPDEHQLRHKSFTGGGFYSKCYEM